VSDQSQSHYAPPKSKLVDTGNAVISRKGRYVIAHPEMEWPARCFKCNEPTEAKKTTKLTYINPWIYLSILITVILTIVLALIYRKKFVLEMPLCAKHLKRRKNALLIQWIIVGAILLFIGGQILTGNDMFIIFSIVAVLALVISTMFSRLAFASKYKNGELWIRGGGKKFLDSLPKLST